LPTPWVGKIVGHFGFSIGKLGAAPLSRIAYCHSRPAGVRVNGRR
jgi:hypothetical protein